MGEGYGPVLISRKFKTAEELRGKRVGTPGPLTTAALLFKIFTPGIINIDLPFDAIMPGIDDGTIDAGIVIHEGQLTYASLGYHKIVDYGESWQRETGGLPLPLGLDVVRRDLGEQLGGKLSDGLRRSIDYGYRYQDESIPYALKWGRGIDRERGERFVKMYVNELTIDMGDRGEAALTELFRLGTERAGMPEVRRFRLV